jgi:hypothetical protein
MRGFSGTQILPLSVGICLAVALANEFSAIPFTFMSKLVGGGVMLPYNRKGINAEYGSSIVGPKGYPAIPERKTA